MSKFKELLEKITDPDLKTALDSEFTTVNTKAGEHGRKLIEKDTEISQLREKVTETASYSEAFKLLKEKGVDTKDIPKMLEKMKLTKTMEDDLKIATQSITEFQSEVSELRRFKKSIEVKDAIAKVLAEEKTNFKDAAGKPIVVIDDFIDSNKLYADIDVTNEVLVRERVKSVLKDGLQTQESMKKKFGFQGNPTHIVPESQGGFGGAVNPAAVLQEIVKKEGPVGAMSEYLKMKKANA
jgi:hypothetical protein